jgi:guanylate kinase
MLSLAKNKAIMIILSAPSGGGKSSIAQKLLQQDDRLSLSISTTTRPPRPGEIDGMHYFFKSRSEFEQMIKDNKFLEYAEIYGNLYGTSLQDVESKLSKNLDILFDIDYQGAHQIMKYNRDRVLSIFINPPSLDVLKDRMKARGQDTDDIIERRFEFAKEEMEFAKYYDYVVVNDDFDRAVSEIQKIINDERIKKREK